MIFLPLNGDSSEDAASAPWVGTAKAIVIFVVFIEKVLSTKVERYVVVDFVITIEIDYIIRRQAISSVASLVEVGYGKPRLDALADSTIDAEPCCVFGDVNEGAVKSCIGERYVEALVEKVGFGRCLDAARLRSSRRIGIL